MPWYWSDDVARLLLADGKIDAQTAAELSTAPVAFRADSGSVEESAAELAEDEEIPLAA